MVGHAVILHASCIQGCSFPDWPPSSAFPLQMVLYIVNRLIFLVLHSNNIPQKIFTDTSSPANEVQTLSPHSWVLFWTSFTLLVHQLFSSLSLNSLHPGLHMKIPGSFPHRVLPKPSVQTSEFNYWMCGPGMVCFIYRTPVDFN